MLTSSRASRNRTQVRVAGWQERRRTPNTHDLGLDKVGIETNPRGFIVIDDQLRTNIPGIWAVGDVNGRGAFGAANYPTVGLKQERLI